jgi:hypothetical protein
LKDVSGYPADEIWLFSVELFHKELKKFNLKLKAKQAEEKQAIDEQISKAKAKRQNQKKR